MVKTTYPLEAVNNWFFFSIGRRHTRCALVTGVQTCALPICNSPLLTRPRTDRAPLDGRWSYEVSQTALGSAGKAITFSSPKSSLTFASAAALSTCVNRRASLLFGREHAPSNRLRLLSKKATLSSGGPGSIHNGRTPCRE